MLVSDLALRYPRESGADADRCERAERLPDEQQRAAVLFALSMAFGVDLFGMLAQALSTQTGQWLAIAFVILLLTGAAVRALSYVRAPP